MASCPRCQRPAATTRPTCLYCGAPLPAAALPAPAAEEAPAPPDSLRSLVILDLVGVEPDRLAQALRLTDLEAGQWVKRGGFRLLRTLEGPAAELEAQRLAEHGLSAAALPEVEVRAALTPLPIRGGRPRGEGLELDLPSGRPQLVTARDLLLVVEGPIAREYQTDQQVRRVRTASLEPGYRYHLHRRTEPRPLELDPGAFDFGGAPGAGSSLLGLRERVAALTTSGGVAVDDGFRRVVPALGPAAPVEGGLLAAAEALRAHRRQEDRTLALDNLPQFRFYSAWRAAWQRRRAG